MDAFLSFLLNKKKKRKTVSRCLGCKLFIHFIYMYLYVSTCVFYLHTGTKNVIRTMLPVFVFPLYCIVVNGARARISPPSQIGQVDWSHPHVLIFFFSLIIIIIVQHFRDQFMIGLPCLFAH